MKILITNKKCFEMLACFWILLFLGRWIVRGDVIWEFIILAQLSYLVGMIKDRKETSEGRKRGE